VQIEQRSVVRLVKNTSYCSFGRDEIFLQLAPVSFDASTFEIWGALLNGGQLVIMTPGTPSLDEIGRAIRRNKVTTIWLTAGLFHLMVDQRLEDLCSLKQILAGGDVLSARHVRKVLHAAPHCTVINGYGPTEGTTFTCCYAMRDGAQVPDPVPIGKPISNTEVHILDRNFEPVAVGQAGELYIGGDGVARGYLNRPELNVEKFIPDQFSEKDGARLYRSGDLARCSADGTIDFLGRSDDQVKINGFRIELGEVETVLQQHTSVGQVAVVARGESANEKKLIAYVIPTTNRTAAITELRDYLQRKLAPYMIPSAFVMMESFPLTPNGKVDRSALPAPEVRQQARMGDPNPKSGLEQLVGGIWQKILGNPNVGLDDNFFDLGGDSLMLMEAHAQLQKTVPNFDLSIVDLFEFATIRSLVKHLAGATSAQHAISEAEERARKQREALAAQKQRRTQQYP
jgi:acyl-coenzyme A synthetase/AMP-(fatty) acid ligase/acyl carrier protein